MNENANLRLLDISYRKDVNKIKFAANNTFLHEMIKASICHILLTKKHKFVTEGRFTSGGRCDIYDVTDNIVYEVMHSEEFLYFQNKRVLYPGDIRELVPVKTNEYAGLSLEELNKKLSTMIEKYSP